MSYIDMTIDLGVLGSQEARVRYEYDQERPATFEHEAEGGFELESVTVIASGIDVLPIIENDPYLMRELVREVKEAIQAEAAP